MKFNKKTKNSESKWFEKNTNKSTNHVYVPQDIFEKLDLKHNSEISLEIKSNSQYITVPVRVYKKTTSTGISFSLDIPHNVYKDIQNSRFFVRITKLGKINTYSVKFKDDAIKIKNNQLIMTEWVNDNQIVVWQKPTGYPTPRPIITNKFLKLDYDILAYLGLYMADGNSKGYYKLFTSTKDIFDLVTKYYNKIILNPTFDTVIGYDKFNKDMRSNSTIVEEIKTHWKSVIPNIDSTKITINTRRRNAKRRSKSHVEFGSVFIKDNRMLSRIFHTFLINSILNKFKDNKEVLTYFFIGAALGDFYPSIRNRNESFNWLEIATNKQEVSVWKNICETLGYKYEEKIREGNRVLLCVYGYTNNIDLLKKGLFLQYKKRRDRMIKGLKNRVETHIFDKFRKSNDKAIEWKGEFLVKTNSFFIVNKGLDLVNNNLIKFDSNVVSITKKGSDFINDLIELNILEVD